MDRTTKPIAVEYKIEEEFWSRRHAGMQAKDPPLAIEEGYKERVVAR